MEIIDIPWPGNNDKVFKEGWTLDPVVACLDGWLKYHGCEPLLPDAFKTAADMIVTSIENGGIQSHPDIYFFPIAYLYRHGIELSLKKLIQHGIRLRILEDNEELCKISTSHKLLPLWYNARIVLETGWPNGDKRDLQNVERLISEFHRYDPSGQNFRYAKNKEGEPTTEHLPFSVNLSELKKTCDGLFSFLDSCASGLSALEDSQPGY